MLKARIFSPVRDSMMANRAKRVAKKAGEEICSLILKKKKKTKSFSYYK